VSECKLCKYKTCEDICKENTELRVRLDAAEKDNELLKIGKGNAEICLEACQNQYQQLEQDLEHTKECLESLRKTELENQRLSRIVYDQIETDRDNLQAANGVLRKKLLNAKEKAMSCVESVRSGLGAGGHGSGMITEVEVGNVVLDCVVDSIDEVFDDILSTPPAEAGERVRGLVEALDEIAYGQECDLTAAVNVAISALAKYRKGME
jgi:hypothetical protein